MIKRLSENHADAICSVINEAAKKFQPVAKSYKSPFVSLEELSFEFRNTDFYGFFDDEKLLAVMGLQRVEEDMALIRNAYVLTSYQRRGIGQLLLNHIEQLAQSQGIKHLLVGTFAKASWAVNFYQKNGYELSSQSQDSLAKYWGHLPELHRQESVVFEKRLE